MIVQVHLMDLLSCINDMQKISYDYLMKEEQIRLTNCVKIQPSVLEDLKK
jgi:hypothetical protein